MNIRQILTDIFITVVLLVIFYIINVSSVYRIADTLFLSGISLIILVAITWIKMGGIFDSINYSFKKMFHSLRKRSFVHPKYETDEKEIELNKSAPPDTFYEYKVNKHKNDSFGMVTYKVSLGLILIILSLFV